MTRAVISHTPKPVARTFADMEAAARAMREGDVRKESLFRQSVEGRKNKPDAAGKEEICRGGEKSQGSAGYDDAFPARLRSGLATSITGACCCLATGAVVANLPRTRLRPSIMPSNAAAMALSSTCG